MIHKSEEEWKKELSEEEFIVTRKKGTERAFSSEMCTVFESGKYACKCCNTPLFDSTTNTTTMKGKHIILVGGNSGIGKSVAEQLTAQGAILFMYSKSGEGTIALDFSKDFEEMPGLPEVIDCAGKQKRRCRPKSLNSEEAFSQHL